MSWFLAALAGPLLFAAANTFDSVLANRHFRSVITLIFYGALLNVILLPLIWLVGRPAWPTAASLLLLFVVAVLDTAYLIPYYLAMRHEDASVVTALFSLSYVFVPVLSFFFLGEVLRPLQYAGFFLIVAGSLYLAWRPGARLRSPRAALYMAVVALLLSVEGVIYKRALYDVSWTTGFFWPRLFAFLLVLPAVSLASFRRDAGQQLTRLRQFLPTLGIEEFVTFLGTAAVTYALSRVSVTVVRAIGALGPIFVLLYAVIFGRRHPQFFREAIDRRSVAAKAAVCLVMIGGVVLVVRP